ncbi:MULTISPECIES: acyl-CoA dehydrogenase family protein [Streptomyces]|uniref:Putative acyl-CoA dehydrogenase n=1 Tax=Streptomyces venezuelae (strain ATCC 10712 / CBS 650.69 / DSM 40230 / JCM 4526 / NBRC 13096 / PD 04745) TaxID=953739 RepID=F2RD08_STRVP|nr:acyl-CoA dehydrogenase family protein [Streptomyces venezuelae]APE22683.1 acyl-CoA dehydrogenase [Streptomyces venezuelae]QES00061.1 acyl-CoA dehydrogenase [Streptomyces venezuelae ATCC 10712]CCA56904.1 putative acyl-CoA dehydrogenase [Streptomyces venezuelae ATCC 10712]
MDFTFTEEQQAAVDAAKAVFAGVSPDAVPSPALTPGAVAEDLDRPLWARLAAADLLGLVVSPEHGGAGLDPVALCLVLRESARVLARVPLLETSAVAMAVERYAPRETAAALLPRVARGELVLTAASQGRTGHDPAERAVTARRDGTGWILDGVQTAVPWAHGADVLAVPAHTPEGAAVLALVPRTHDGLGLAAQYSTSGELLAELTLDAVRLDGADVIDAEGAWEWLRELLTTGTCALALGLGEAVLTMTSQYTGKREQFGHPVATFQAVAVQAADRYIDLRAMEVTLWQAAWRLGGGAEGAALPAAGDVAVAKIWASEGVRRVVQTAQHLHGGFGADTDYPLHRYHAWAKHLELSLGPAAAHEDALGDLLAAHPLG